MSLFPAYPELKRDSHNSGSFYEECVFAPLPIWLICMRGLSIGFLIKCFQVTACVEIFEVDAKLLAARSVTIKE